MFKRFYAVILIFAMIFLASCAAEPIASDDESSAVSASRVTFSEKDTDITEKNANIQHETPDATASESKITRQDKKKDEQKNGFTAPNNLTVPNIQKEDQRNDKEEKKRIENNEPVPEIADGISLLSKTSPVSKGYQASITVMGTPNKKFTVEFYKNGMKDPAKQSDLSEKTSNDAGIVTWTFSVPFDCSYGNNMVIIKESGSSNKLQTSINVK